GDRLIPVEPSGAPAPASRTASIRSPWTTTMAPSLSEPVRTSSRRPQRSASVLGLAPVFEEASPARAESAGISPRIAQRKRRDTTLLQSALGRKAAGAGRSASGGAAPIEAEGIERQPEKQDDGDDQ